MGAADDGMLSDGTVHGRTEDELLLTWLLAMSHGRIIARGSSTDHSKAGGFRMAVFGLACGGHPQDGLLSPPLGKLAVYNSPAFFLVKGSAACSVRHRTTKLHSVSEDENMFIELKVLRLRGQQHLSSVLARGEYDESIHVEVVDW